MALRQKAKVPKTAFRVTRHQAQVTELLLARDRLETQVLQLTRQLEALSTVHHELLTAMSAKTQLDAFEKMLSEAYQEVEVPEDQCQWLTPRLEEREGVE